MDLWGIHNKDDRFWWRFETIETRMSKAIFPWNKKFNNPSKKNVTDTFQNLNLHLMFRIWFASCYFYCSSLITHRLKMLRMVPLMFFSKAFHVGMVTMVHSVCGCSYPIFISRFLFILFHLSHPTPCAHLYLTPNEGEKTVKVFTFLNWRFCKQFYRSPKFFIISKFETLTLDKWKTKSACGITFDN